MKRKNRYFDWAGVLLLLSFSYGCKKLVEIRGNAADQLTSDQVFADSLSAVRAVVGIYQSNISYESPFCGDVTLFAGLTADELTTSSSFYRPYVNNSLIPGNVTYPGGSSGPIWNGFYNNTMIYAANADIEGVTASAKLSPFLKDQLIGECKVIRALAYFYLVNFFGDVPKVTSSSYLVNNTLPRSPADSIYALIIADLTDAAGRLQPVYPSAQRARPNRYTAMALLARAYLYREKWADADSLCSVLINSGIYHLETTPSKVFLDGSAEAIWQAPGVSYNAGVTYEGSIFIPYSATALPSFYLTPYLLAAFEPGDRRITQWMNTATVGGVPYIYPYKYKNSNSSVPSGTESYMILRLAEVYLIRAEARIEEGQLADAAQDINTIRSRAGLPDIKYNSIDDLRSALRRERQTELFCEWGHRWMDLKRTRKVDSILAAEKGSIWPSDGHASLYPIPADQLRLNPALTQNPGY